MPFIVAQEYQILAGAYDRSGTLAPVAPAKSVLVFDVSPDQTNISSDANPTTTSVLPLKLNGILLAAPTVTRIINNNGVKSTGYAG